MLIVERPCPKYEQADSAVIADLHALAACHETLVQRHEEGGPA